MWLLLGVAAATSRPVLDGTFGANCPPCKDFGSTVLKRLYAVEGVADGVEFQLHSAIRSAGAIGKDHAWDCPDEDVGCPMTRWFLCAVDGWNTTTTTQHQRVSFLTCWDEAAGAAKDKAKDCAATVGFDWDRVTSCHDGPKGDSLQLTAASAFEKRFPSHAHSGIFDVPHIFISGQELSYPNLQFDSVLRTLCKAGLQADACPNA